MSSATKYPKRRLEPAVLRIPLCPLGGRFRAPGREWLLLPDKSHLLRAKSRASPGCALYASLRLGKNWPKNPWFLGISLPLLIFRSISRPGATHFCDQTKVGKSWLRTYGSKNSLVPAGVRPPITGACPPKGRSLPPRALRPPAVEHSTFLSPPTAPAAAEMGKPFRVRKR